MPEITAEQQKQLDQINTDIHYRNIALGHLHTEANAYEDRAAAMRTLAASLTTAIQPLRSAFNPIRSLHTTQTWEGQAATASRTRLDGHEIRHNTAIRSIDGLIDDLVTEAAVAEQRRSTTLGEIDDIRWQIHLLKEQT